MDRKQIQILCGIILAINIISTNAYAAESSSDWRPDYKLMVGTYYTNNYDEALNNAKTCLDKVMRLTNPTEKSVALDELIKYLNMMGGRNGQQQNYSQQEQLLKCKLKANEAKYSENPANNYQTDQIRKELATCLVLQGKSKEAATYLTKSEKLNKGPELTGWKKDIDLLSQANINRGPRSYGNTDPDKLCEYATNTVNDILAIKNATEKEVAINQVTQQLQMAEYRYKNDKDYPHEEKILKLLLKIQEASSTGDDLGVGAGIGIGLGRAYVRTSTLQELVTCLVMQNKDDEAADYNKMYKEETEKMLKKQQTLMKNVMDKVTPVVDDKNKSTDKKE